MAAFGSCRPLDQQGTVLRWSTTGETFWELRECVPRARVVAPVWFYVVQALRWCNDAQFRDRVSKDFRARFRCPADTSDEPVRSVSWVTRRRAVLRSRAVAAYGLGI